MTSKLFVRRAIVAAFVTMTLAAARTASAQTAGEPEQCYAQLGNCYYMAALQNGFWSMWAAGIDCELNFLDCVRRNIVGA